MNNNQFNQQKKEFSEEKGNMEIVPSEKREVAERPPMATDNDVLDLKKGGKIVIGRLNFIVAPLKRRHEKFYRESKFHLAADIVLALIVLGLATALVWAIFFRQPIKNVFLDVGYEDGEITSGRLETFIISYGNKSEEELRDGKIAIELPKHFTLESAAPADAFDSKINTFKLGDLASGSNGKIKIKGLVLGETGSQQTFSVIFSYAKAGRKESVLNSLTYPVEGSALELNLISPAEVYQRALWSGEIKLKNKGEKDLDNVELVFTEEWEIKQASCVFDENIMVVGKIKSGEEVSVNFSAIAPSKEGTSLLAVESFLGIGKEKLKQGQAEKEVAVSAPRFKLSLDTSDKRARPGEEIAFKLAYQNNEQESARNVKINFTSVADNFILSDLSLGNGAFYRESGNNLAVAELAPGASGAIDFRARFSRKSVKTEEEIYPAVIVNYDIAGQSVSYTVKSPAIKILSDLKVGSAGYYYSPQGDQLGVGPLPPAVDMPTSYWIFWQADNHGNNLKNFAMAAQLPANVVWTGNKSLLAGNLQFGEVSRRIVWTIDEINKNGGNYQVGFEVTVIPAATDVGKALNLLTGVQYSAYDTFCEEEISGRLANITTDLEADKLAAGLGKVTD